jgi:16S rRNA (adenine1518-N6/adenine1519-N6)-dimethyltransferase
VTPTQVRALLGRFGLAAQRQLGQNFLCDELLAGKLVRRAQVGPGDAVVEIGTGLGILTCALAARARRVVTVEVDAGIVRALCAEERLPASVELVHADALDLDLGAILEGLPAPRRVVANLPYAVATPLLRRLLDLAPLLESWSVMVQREVARRMSASPGSRDYGSLAVLHHLCVRVGPGLDVHPHCFYPVPRVVSTFVHVTPLPGAPTGPALAAIERIVRGAFVHRRKTLVNALRASGVTSLDAVELARRLGTLGLPAKGRAEAVPPQLWPALVRALAGAPAAQA